MTTQFKKFRDTLDEIFMLDHAELDFGIYRIMNQKREDIGRYLDSELEKQVQAELKRHLSSSINADKQELATLEATLRSAGMDPDQSPKVQEQKAKIGSSVDMASLEAEVYNHLATFFKRYYEGGDFMSMRRYKKDVYAIPYEGEEVKLHWANADQYYIKTSEYFQNYTFKTSDGRTVNFRLRDASTEQNNNKIQGDQERKFRLCDSDIITGENDELNIWFTYEPMPKTTKQKQLQEEAFDKLKGIIPATWQVELLRPAPTEKDKARTLLEKHINDYVSRNSFDYFIHKDLGTFLRRELDFYVKNEVFYIDDIDTQNPEKFLSYLSQVKTIKAVGQRLITFLAQLEDFQKKLWLKKKFIVECNYCITLDRVPQELYPEIARNDTQRQEWVRLFAIDEIKSGGGDMFSSGKTAYSDPLSVGFLKDNPYLVLDTAFFDERFKQRLVQSIDNFDEQLDGTLINSENFQALNLLQEKYREQVKCIYIDPPFNLKQNGDFLYRTDYKDSTWATLINDRINISKGLLTKNGFFYLRCDNNGNFIARPVLDSHLGNDKFLCELLVQRIRKNVTEQGRISLPLANDSLFLYSNTDNYEFANPFIKLQQVRESYWRRIDDSAGFRNPPERTIFGKVYHPYKRDAHFKFSQDSINRMTEDGRIRIVCKECATPHTSGVWTKCPNCNNTEATPQYLVNATDKKILDTNWLDIAGYSSKTGFSTENAEVLLDRAIELTSNEHDIVLDYFGGSGTTPAVSIQKKRKWLCVEMGNQFYDFILPRLKKELSKKQGIFKYLSLEQYEDTLNNLVLAASSGIDFSANENFGSGFLLGYMLDTETRGSLFNTKWFENPFDFRLRVTRNNELVETRIDLVETFNYLVGLNVAAIQYPKAGLCVIEGITRRGEKTLVLWRDCSVIDNTALEEALRKLSYNTLDTEFDIIYVNGDNTLQNTRRDDEHWKVTLIEQEFANRMFEK